MSRTKHHGDKAKQRLYGDNWQWMKAEPKIWRNIHKHSKQRVACKRCLQEVMRGIEPTFPQDKKPWEYYW